MLLLLSLERVSFLREVGHRCNILLDSNGDRPLILHVIKCVRRDIPCRWTNRIAILLGKDLAAALTVTIRPILDSPPRSPAARDCIPPIEFPTLAYNFSIPRKSRSLNCALTISKMVMIGKLVAYGFSVLG